MLIFRPQEFGMTVVNFVPQVQGYTFYSCGIGTKYNTTHITTKVAGPFTLYATHAQYDVNSSAAEVIVDGVAKQCNQSSCWHLFDNNITILDKESILSYVQPSLVDAHKVCSTHRYWNPITNRTDMYTTCVTHQTCVTLQYSPFKKVMTSSVFNEDRDVVIGIPTTGS